MPFVQLARGRDACGARVAAARGFNATQKLPRGSAQEVCKLIRLHAG